MVMWYANRGTGVVLVALLTVSTVLGVLSTARAGTSRWPRFATQGLHRNVSLLSMIMLLAHVATPVLDDFTDLVWYQAAVPFGGSFVAKERLPMALGAAGFDLLVVITITSLVRAFLLERVDHHDLFDVGVVRDGDRFAQCVIARVVERMPHHDANRPRWRCTLCA